MTAHSFSRRSLLYGVALAALAGCAGKGEGDRSASTSATSDSSGSSHSGPTYDSVDSIGAVSNSVIVGRFTTFDKAVDDGGDPNGDVKLPMRIGTFKVDQSGSELPPEVQVALPVSGEGDEDDPLLGKLNGVKTGTTYLFFGEKVAKSERGGLQQYGDLYNIVGHADGIFEVDGEKATPVGPGIPRTSAQVNTKTATNSTKSQTYLLDDLLRIKTKS
ncbi:MAG: hypothetical protein LKI24_07050 [Acidipropionibacterium sp.]|jgi:hypothetical protein|nr:hypothetical protein [Acidipropionibacterium sp.]